MKNNKFTIAVSALFLLSCNEKPKDKNPLGEQDIIAVRVADVSSLNMPSSIIATGLVGTEDQAN